MENIINHDSQTINEFLLEMSDDIIFMNIEDQIKDSNNESENYFDFIMDKLDCMIVILSTEDGELKTKVEELKDDICDRVQKLLEDRFDFVCDFNSSSDRSQCLRHIYKFFIIRKRRILENLVVNFLEREKSSLLLKYGKNKANKKDVTVINNKNTMEKSKLNLILNVHNIISDISLVDVEDTLDLLIDDKDEFTYNFILSLYNQEEITFGNKFNSIILDEIKKEKNNLIMKLRLYLMEN